MMQPRPESRIKSLEQRATDIEAKIVELSSDTAEELKAVRQDIRQLDEHMNKSFDQAHAYIQELVETRLDRIETTMATKEDIRKIETRFDKIEGRIDEQGKKLDLLLQLVQRKLGE